MGKSWEVLDWDWGDETCSIAQLEPNNVRTFSPFGIIQIKQERKEKNSKEQMKRADNEMLMAFHELPGAQRKQCSAMRACIKLVLFLHIKHLSRPKPSPAQLKATQALCSCSLLQPHKILFAVCSLLQFDGLQTINFATRRKIGAAQNATLSWWFWGCSYFSQFFFFFSSSSSYQSCCIRQTGARLLLLLNASEQ